MDFFPSFLQPNDAHKRSTVRININKVSTIKLWNGTWKKGEKNRPTLMHSAHTYKLVYQRLETVYTVYSNEWHIRRIHEVITCGAKMSVTQRYWRLIIICSASRFVCSVNWKLDRLETVRFEFVCFFFFSRSQEGFHSVFSPWPEQPLKCVCLYNVSRPFKMIRFFVPHTIPGKFVSCNRLCWYHCIFDSNVTMHFQSFTHPLTYSLLFFCNSTSLHLSAFRFPTNYETYRSTPMRPIRLVCCYCCCCCVFVCCKVALSVLRGRHWIKRKRTNGRTNERLNKTNGPTMWKLFFIFLLSQKNVQLNTNNNGNSNNNNNKPKTVLFSISIAATLEVLSFFGSILSHSIMF